ncbi:conserved hypothetical protein [Lebetimonas natsushimae]|uniref:Uncharacterized protein n=1 Tax=Lebetimonas natsushimae TaxID=1936991 RepID=A0A292YCY4_9BACT|nr:AsmA-like C-terminal domain-containing protein [Lebetimonas natsushimae]GAX87316.1 conserved hypothetical protein [Lebetimonas natsushimae]
MNTIKTSIAAIIGTILFFLSIIFFSLFKGITLYNINIKNIHVKKIFIKIEQNKISGNVYISSFKQNSEKIKINKIFTYLKLLNYIKKFTIIAPNLYIKYNNPFLTINDNDINLKAYIKKFFPDISLVISTFKYKNIKLNNINLNLKNKIIYSKINGNFYYQNFSITFSGKLYPLSNKLILNISSPKLSINFNSYPVKLYDLYSKIKININTNNIQSTTNIKNLNLVYNNIPINAQNIVIAQNNSKVNILINNTKIKEFKKLKNILARNIKINSNLKNFYTSINIDNVNSHYKKYSIMLNNINIFVPNKEEALINIKNTVIKNKDFSFLLDKTYIIKKTNNISYSINSTKLLSQRIKANSSKIEGDKNEILNKIISGIFDGFNFKIVNNKFDISHKIYTSEKINFNNAAINNLKIDFIKKQATFNSKEYFNEKINNILQKELNISIPLTQISGENNVTGIINFDKNISFNIKIYSKNPVLKLDTLPLQAKEANITVTPTFTSFNIFKSYLEIAKGINLLFTGKGKVNYKPLILTLNGIIENFVVYPILDVKNFKESVKMDLNTLELYLKNSHTYINLDKQNIIINNLKPILPYSPLKDIVKNGILYISFAKNIKALSYIKPVLPIFYKHNNKPIKKLSNLNINKIMLNIELNKNKIILYNNYIQFFMDNNHSFLSLKNIDIDLFPLEKFYYKNLNQKTTKNQNIIINLQNSNILYKTHKFLSQKAEIRDTNNSVSLESIYKNSKIKGYTKQNYFLLEGKHFSKEEFDAFLPKFNFFKEINLDFTLVKSPEDYYIGNVYINSATVSELKALNNTIAFLNTIPSFLSLSSPGFSAKGYKIKKGNIQYLLYKKILYIKKSQIIGQNIDFFSKGYIDFNKNYINLKTTAVLKLKIKKIPIIGKGLSYLFLGKDGNINVNIIIKGNLDNPKIQKDIGKAIIPNPFELFKRAITLPFNLF